MEIEPLIITNESHNFVIYCNIHFLLPVLIILGIISIVLLRKVNEKNRIKYIIMYVVSLIFLICSYFSGDFEPHYVCYSCSKISFWRDIIPIIIAPGISATIRVIMVINLLIAISKRNKKKGENQYARND